MQNHNTRLVSHIMLQSNSSQGKECDFDKDKDIKAKEEKGMALNENDIFAPKDLKV